MKLEKGMFIRTNLGIEKITSLESEYNVLIAGVGTKQGFIQKKRVLKSSFNLIELIEVGDYINGYRVVGSSSQMVNNEEKRIIYTNEEEYRNGGWISKRFDYEEKNKITTILTHEQYEANCYKVVE